MTTLSRQQLLALVAVTLIWGLNWPMMKLGVSHYPPLTFRTISMWLGLPVMALGVWLLKNPLTIARQHWGELFKLTVFNMLIWHGLMILAVKSLSSGRAAILGYSMPTFSALIGAFLFGVKLSGRAWGGVAAAAVGVVLLLWHEFSNLSGNPLAVGMALLSAGSWALGIQLLRRTTLQAPTLTISFWMTLITAIFMALMSLIFERDAWQMPPQQIWLPVAYNAILIFGIVQTLWLFLARHLTPVASTLSVMFIPVIGLFSGALWLGEVLHWQDWAAVLLMALAIAAVLLPARQAR